MNMLNDKTINLKSYSSSVLSFINWIHDHCKQILKLYLVHK